MPRLQGNAIASPTDHFAIIQSRFNQTVTDTLTAGAVDALTRHGALPDHIDVILVPGALEIPFAAARALNGKYAAVICLGAVVRGETPHFDYVAQNSVAQVVALSARGDVPLAMGILTCDTMEQARDRAGGKSGNKGADAALTALEMVNLARQLPGSAAPAGD